MAISRRSCAGTAKKLTKNCGARAKLLFCSLNLLLFFVVAVAVANVVSEGPYYRTATATKTSLKNEVTLLQTLARLFHLIQFVKCR